MLAALPDECKQLLWRFFDAPTLCRVACVARRVDDGVALAPLWQSRAVAMVRSELVRIEQLRLPVEGALKRQNATRRLELSAPAAGAARGNLGLLQGQRGDDDEVSLLARSHVDETFWRDWYRDFHLASRRFDASHAAFDAAKNELQELKRQRTDLRELLQATKTKSQGDKQLRRMQMNCVRWLNRTSRRAAAETQARSSQFSALGKSEITDELQAVESAIQWQSKTIFSLRSQYQKALHRLTSEVARGKRVLADLDE